MNTPFYQKLTEYCEQDLIPWHMPGHKRQLLTEDKLPGSEIDMRMEMEAAKRYDVTELPALDDLYEPGKSLSDSMDNLSKIYGSVRSYYQVNGSTGGILAAISACVRRGEAILMARNCHRSVYHAVALLELVPYYLDPPMLRAVGIYGGISAAQVDQAFIEHPEIKAVVFTSPTYEGVVSDVADIVRVAHAAGAYVIVDEAHGAHFTYDAQELSSSVACGADLVIESLHKTLPCYTQCAILHIGRQAADQETFIRRVERYIRVYQTTSPSYVLIADMERVTSAMEAWRTTEFPAYLARLRRYREAWKGLQHIRLLSLKDVEEYGGYGYDETRLVLIPEMISGERLRELLEDRYGQVMEMASLKYALAISTVMDSEEAFARLDKALWELDSELDKETEAESADRIDSNTAQMSDRTIDSEDIMIPVLTEDTGERIPGEAWNLPSEDVAITKACGRLAGDYVTVYPPGIPVCVPGERITREVIGHLIRCYREGLTIQGIRSILDRDVSVICSDVDGRIR